MAPSQQTRASQRRKEEQTRHMTLSKQTKKTVCYNFEQSQLVCNYDVSFRHPRTRTVGESDLSALIQAASETTTDHSDRRAVSAHRHGVDTDGGWSRLNKAWYQTTKGQPRGDLVHRGHLSARPTGDAPLHRYRMSSVYWLRLIASSVATARSRSLCRALWFLLPANRDSRSYQSKPSRAFPLVSCSVSLSESYIWIVFVLYNGSTTARRRSSTDCGPEFHGGHPFLSAVTRHASAPRSPLLIGSFPASRPLKDRNRSKRDHKQTFLFFYLPPSPRSNLSKGSTHLRHPTVAGSLSRRRSTTAILATASSICIIDSRWSADRSGLFDQPSVNLVLAVTHGSGMPPWRALLVFSYFWPLIVCGFHFEKFFGERAPSTP
uniref:C3H1-type domain-containing protein n=1 Tax=Steinernema glaseri TaxID=37863 RepID=A0A1I7ZED0_9BILA